LKDLIFLRQFVKTNLKLLGWYEDLMKTVSQFHLDISSNTWCVNWTSKLWALTWD